MHHRHTFAFGATLLALVSVLIAASSALAGGSGPKVTVRIEGTSRTLLVSSAVQPGSGIVKKGGHSCSADSGAGALNSATKGSWSGSWSSSLSDWEVTRILGETDNYDTTHSYWSVFVDNVAASTGICGVKLHSGEQILLAAVGASESPADPLGLVVPSSATVQKGFTAKVVYYTAKGKPKPLANATVAFAGHTTTTNADGETGSLVPTSAGSLTLRASKKGYIRTEATLKVAAG